MNESPAGLRGAATGPRDPGLQAERTALAWTRTAVAVVANALLALRAGVAQQHWLVAGLGVVLLLCAATLTTFGVLRRGELLGQAGPRSPSPWMPLGTVAFALTCCIAAIATVRLSE